MSTKHANATTNVSGVQVARTGFVGPNLGWTLNSNCIVIPGRGVVWVSAPARKASHSVAPNQRRLCWPVPSLANNDSITPRIVVAGDTRVTHARQVVRKTSPGWSSAGCAACSRSMTACCVGSVAASDGSVESEVGIFVAALCFLAPSFGTSLLRHDHVDSADRSRPRRFLDD